LKITFLGTGTSQGVPVIGCECDTCLSDDPRDKRLRSSVFIETHGLNVLIDTGPDLRQQMLTSKIKRLDAILFTHEHNDHTIGLDDIRPFNFLQKSDIPVYGLKRVLEEIKGKFAYIFDVNPYPGAPRIVCHDIVENHEFALRSGFNIMPVGIMHGTLPILGYRIGKFAYITDASYISPSSIDLLSGIDVLVINALQYRKHYSHFTYDESVYVAGLIGAPVTYLTHMSHEMGYCKDILSRVPQGIFPAYDGLVLDVAE
jgi:phosphoribosyl 1,2-cyclic phosphate phosphodiesterase